MITQTKTKYKKNCFQLFHKHKFDIVIIFLVLTIMFAFMLEPKLYMQKTLLGFNVFFNNVFPALFPFFIFTKILTEFSLVNKLSIFFTPFTSFCFKTSGITSYIFLISLLSGYPVGAKLTAEIYQNGYINHNEMLKTLTFTSNSGPIFVIGTVGASMLLNVKAGLIIYVSHILGAILNGILYRNYGTCTPTANTKLKIKFENKNINKIIADGVYNSIISILLVGAYITIFFLIISIIQNNEIYQQLTQLFSQAFYIPQNVIKAIFSGILELTSGCLQIANAPISNFAKILICCGLTSLGGLSITLQAYQFLKECNVKLNFFVKQKITHTLLSLEICVIIMLIF